MNLQNVALWAGVAMTGCGGVPRSVEDDFGPLDAKTMQVDACVAAHDHETAKLMAIETLITAETGMTRKHLLHAIMLLEMHADAAKRDRQKACDGKGIDGEQKVLEAKEKMEKQQKSLERAVAPQAPTTEI